MAFPQSFIDELMARNPIEEVVGQYVSLKRSGANLFGLCPFHGEKTPSFSVAPDKGIYYCFGCHKGGNAVNFMMEIEGLSYPDAVRALAKRAGMEVPDDPEYQNRYRKQERLWAVCKEAARYFNKQLYLPAGQQGLAYAMKRGMPKGTLTRFGIGFAPDGWSNLTDAMHQKGYTDQELMDAGLASSRRDGKGVVDKFRNRLMFPIIDVRGNVIGFGGRVMDDSKPKYLNSPETLIFNKRKNLFALNLAKKTKLPYLILVEGYMDAVALHQFGFDCAVASLGTSLTDEHAVLLSRYTEQVVLIYDGDEAGQNATKRAIPMLEKAGLNVKVLQMRDAKDPDEFLKKFGADRFKILLEESSNRVEYQLRAIAKKYDLKSDEERVAFIADAAAFCATLSNAVQREIYGKRAADAAGISYEAMKIEVEKAFKRKVYRDHKKQEKIDLDPAKKLQPKSRNFHYDNLRSAMAEEGVLSLIVREPALLDLSKNLEPENFSCPLLGKVYGQLREQFREGAELSVSSLQDLEADEMSHVAGILQRHQGPVSDQAYTDCVRIILSENQSSHIETEEDLMAFQKKMKERKGIRE